jgi:hypothetical protein
MPPIELDDSSDLQVPLSELNKNLIINNENNNDNHNHDYKSKDINKNYQIKNSKNEEIVLVPTPVDYAQYMKMQYSRDFSNFENKNFLKENLDSNKNSINFQGGLIPKYLKDFYNFNNNNETNLNILEQQNYKNYLQDHSNDLLNLDYASKITRNAHFDMGLINNKPLKSNELSNSHSDAFYGSNSKLNSNIIPNFLESESQPQINNSKAKLNYIDNTIDIKNFMKSQEEDIQKYFNNLNKLEYEKVYNRINDINKEQEIFNKIKNSDGNLDFNGVWKEFQISSNKKVKNNMN